jgi:hypothetical protein
MSPIPCTVEDPSWPAVTGGGVWILFATWESAEGVRVTLRMDGAVVMKVIRV